MCAHCPKKAIWKIFKHGNVPNQHWENAGSLSGNLFSTTRKE
jgi:hypothetical protein